uniref:Rho guanine nucleotide exchange factor (GEF) 12b n=1 Tax=Oncorhynchus tshawytscha TaxID=74940 RepID=A0A8C8HEP2_ONCTS
YYGTQCRSLETLSILSKDHPPDKKPKSDKNTVPPLQEFDPTGLVQRCVIIQKDENGFGLTVSGDNPVFVQLVKEGKVNGSLVTHSNHVEVVKLIKSGSYVALTVLGRPPGLAQVPLSEGEGGDPGVLSSSLSSPHSPGTMGGTGERCSTSTSPQDHIISPLSLWAMKEEYSRNPTAKLLKDIQEAKKHIPMLRGQLRKATGTPQVYPPTYTHVHMFTHMYVPLPESPCQRETPCHNPKTTPRDSLNSCPSPDAEDTPDLCSVGSPLTCLNPQIIGAEDDYFDTEQEQINGQCCCFQSIELLKSRPAHLAAFLHHVVSQFDPAPLLCYLYADLYKQTNSKETRRIFMDFYTFFMDRAANLKVAVPESIASELDRRRPELIPEELHRQYTQLLQDTLLPDIQGNLEDFRQKRSMGLTLAEGELSKLDTERVRDRVALDRERSFSEIHCIVLCFSTTMQYVILTYMKHLGVKVKEPRSLEPKRVRINFLPKIKVQHTHTQMHQLMYSDWLHSDDTQNRMAHPTSTHFDFSPCTLEQLQEEERETTCCSHVRMQGLGFPDVPNEDDLGNEIECKQDSPNWQTLVSREVLAGLTPQEIKRQEVINELFYTERAHLRMLKVLDNVFYQKLTRDSILPPGDIKHIFTNLEEIVQLHVSITEQVTVIRKKNETSVIDLIGDDLLAWFSDGEEEKIKRAVGTFCSNQPFALELIKTRQKKDQRFTSFMQEAESNRLCRRLQLKDIIPVEMQRLTKYPLLLESIAKYTEDAAERDKVKRAGECCRKILNYVNQTVKEAENKQRLEDYQRRLDLSSLKQSENPMISEFKSLDLTKRKMVHEGPLSWKVNKDKTIELYTLLLEDILVLLQKQDERLVLKCHSKNLAGTADTKHIFSPIIKLNTVLVRSVATDNKSFFVLSMSDNGAQIYELMAQTVSEQRTWQCLITQRADTMKMKPHNIIPLPQTDAERDAVEEISTGIPKLSKDPDRLSTGSIQFAGINYTTFNLVFRPYEKLCEEVEEVDEEEVEAFLVGELADRLPLLQERSCQGIAIDDQEPHDAFVMPPSRAEEALRTLAALRQVLLNHMTSREEGSDKNNENRKEKEQRKGLAHGARLLRTTSLRGPEDSNSSTSGPTSAAASSPGSSENGTAGREEGAPGSSELPSGDTGFFETSEDFGSYNVLGGSGESSTDDDGQASGKGGGRAQWGSDIDLKKLLSSSSQTGDAGPNLSRQVMTHIRLLQANLQQIIETCNE